jgi:hypothetical protein
MKKKPTAKRDIGVAWNVLGDYIEFGKCESYADLFEALNYLTYLASQVTDPPTLDAYRTMMRFDGRGPVLVLNRRELARRRTGAA